MNQPQVDICPLPPEWPHPTPLACAERRTGLPVNTQQLPPDVCLTHGSVYAMVVEFYTWW